MTLRRLLVAQFVLPDDTSNVADCLGLVPFKFEKLSKRPEKGFWAKNFEILNPSFSILSLPVSTVYVDCSLRFGAFLPFKQFFQRKSMVQKKYCFVSPLVESTAFWDPKEKPNENCFWMSYKSDHERRHFEFCLSSRLSGTLRSESHSFLHLVTISLNNWKLNTKHSCSNWIRW